MTRAARLAVLLSLALAFPLFAQKGIVYAMKVQSKALVGNLTGEPIEQSFAVYTPPGYAGSTARYPVVYLLHGIADSYQTWIDAFKIDDMLDRMIGSKQIPPILLVMPNAGNRFLGSYYLNSPVTGRWADLIANEIVPIVDTKFRTIPNAQSRAIVGHSMGGFGAIEFGMTRPDVFRVVYAISPCCLDDIEDVGAGNFAAWRTALTFKGYEDVDAALKNGDFYPVALVGLLSAMSPNAGAPLNIEFPLKRAGGELLRVHPAYEDFRARFPVHSVPSHRDNLLKLRLLALDAGFDDQFAHIPPSTMALSRALFDAGIPHRLEVYQGDHREKVAERMEKIVFPMIVSALKRDEDSVK